MGKCFLTYIHLDLFRFHSLVCKIYIFSYFYSRTDEENFEDYGVVDLESDSSDANLS